MPPPLLPLAPAWQVGAIALIVSGALNLVTWTTSSVDVLSVLGVLAVSASMFVAVMLLKGVPWARWCALLLMAIGPLAIAVFLVRSVGEPPQSDVEDMRPIVWMGGMMWIAAAVAPLIWLMATPRPFRYAPAAWLRDPLDPFKVRFWNGVEWTEWTAPLAPQVGFHGPWRNPWP